MDYQLNTFHNLLHITIMVTYPIDVLFKFRQRKDMHHHGTFIDEIDCIIDSRYECTSEIGSHTIVAKKDCATLFGIRTTCI